mmetsp:Transcript_29999/g.73866  ORF Transcript_29999/g.73866 Transcript_29999/m.73866 type:complete len:212 (+) Transcript_29999:116-751(+)
MRPARLSNCAWGWIPPPLQTPSRSRATSFSTPAGPRGRAWRRWPRAYMRRAAAPSAPLLGPSLPLSTSQTRSHGQPSSRCSLSRTPSRAWRRRYPGARRRRWSRWRSRRPWRPRGPLRWRCNPSRISSLPSPRPSPTSSTRCPTTSTATSSTGTPSTPCPSASGAPRSSPFPTSCSRTTRCRTAPGITTPCGRRGTSTSGGAPRCSDRSRS